MTDHMHNVAQRSWEPLRQAFEAGFAAYWGPQKPEEVDGFLRDMSAAWSDYADDVLSAAQPPAASVETKSAPEDSAPHNSGERLPSSDAATAGADTQCSAGNVDQQLEEAGKAAIAIRNELDRTRAERDSWKAQFDSAAAAASEYSEFWEKHSGDFDQFGNYLPYSQMDGDLRAAKAEIERLRALPQTSGESERDLREQNLRGLLREARDYVEVADTDHSASLLSDINDTLSLSRPHGGRDDA